MKKKWVKDLINWVIKKPIVILEFNESDSYSIINSRNGTRKFSHAKNHRVFEQIKAPTACIFSLIDDGKKKCFFGVLKSKSAISTLDTKIMIKRVEQIKPNSIDRIVNLIETKRFRNLFKQKTGAKHAPQVNSNPKCTT